MTFRVGHFEDTSLWAETAGGSAGRTFQMFRSSVNLRERKRNQCTVSRIHSHNFLSTELHTNSSTS